MRNRSRTWRLIAALLALSMVAASCGSDSDETSEAGSEEDNTETSAAETDSGDDTSTAGETDGDSTDGDASGGTFRYGYNVQLTNWDPHKSTIAQDSTWLAPVYDRLVHVSPDGDLIPGLALSWEFSEDGLTLTFNLREGVTFHDGAAFNAEAVKTNIEREKGLGEDGPVAKLLATVETVEVVDEFTAQFNLTQPSASLVGLLSERPGAMISPDALASGVDLSVEEAGTGMYTLASYQEGDRAVYTPYAEYWDPDAVKIDQLEIVDMVDSTTRLNALLDGQLDSARILPDGLTKAGDAGLTIEQAPTLEVWWLILNHNIADLDNPLVRQAITHAIDKQGIIDALWNGAASEVTQLFPPGYYATSPEADSLYPFDLDKAKALMEEAGSSGFDLPVVHTADPEYTAFITVIQQQLKPLGINVIPEPLPVSEAVSKWYASEGIIFGPWSGRPDPYTTVQGAFAEASTFSNAPAKTSIPEIEELLVKIEASSGDERTAMIQRVNQIATELAFHIPVLAPNFINASYDYVEGLDIYATSKPEFRGVTLNK